jgi:hypothetical protein
VRRPIVWLAFAAAFVASPSAAVDDARQFRAGEPLAAEASEAYIFFRADEKNGNYLLMRERPTSQSGTPGSQAGDDPRREPGRWFRITNSPRFTAAKNEATYLVALPPGSYVVYGNIAVVSDSIAVGTCLCMGSVRFEARAGEVADLGELIWPDVRRSERPWAIRVVPYDGSMSQAPQMAGLTVRPASYSAAGKIPNYFGVEISRHPALAGILAYARDSVIDVKSNSVLPAGD